MAVSVCSVIALPAFRGKRHSVYEEGVLDFILIHCVDVLVVDIILNWPRVSESTLFNGAFASCAVLRVSSHLPEQSINNYVLSGVESWRSSDSSVDVAPVAGVVTH